MAQMEPRSYEFFISYPPLLRPLARDLHERLAGTHSVFSGAEPDSADLNIARLDGLRASRIVVVLLSKDTIESAFQRVEIDSAFTAIDAEDGPDAIVPVFVDPEGLDLAPDLRLGDLQGIRFWEDRDVDALAARLRAVADGDLGASKVAPPQAQQVEHEEELKPEEAMGALRRHDALAVVTVERTGSAASAFIVAPDLALTAAHYLPKDTTRVLLRVWGESKRDPIGAAVDVRDDELDVVLLKLERETAVEPLRLAPSVDPGEHWELWAPDLEKPTLSTTKSSGRAREVTVRTDGLAILQLDIDEGTIPRGASGAPVMVDEQVVGILREASDREAGAVPTVSMLSNARIAQRLRAHVEQPHPRAWVALLGGTTGISEPTLVLARRIGRTLANNGMGLVTGGFGGVDETAAREYLHACLRTQRQPHVLVIGEGSTPRPMFERFEAVGTNNWALETVHRSDLLVVLDGGASVEWVADRAWDQGRPVLPLPTGGPGAALVRERVVDNWEARQIPGLDRNDLVNAGLDPIELLDRVLAELEDLGAPLVTALPTRPQLGNDRIFGPDLLDVDEQAELFARAVASRDLNPPLAIGLFGDWGSGKSYFMHLMREAIRAKEGTAGNCKKICHIEFNAWHYMDSDLWASLAGRIFDVLADSLVQRDDNTKDSRAKTRQQLRERLRSTFDAKQEAEATARAAASRLDQLHAEIADLGNKRENALQRVTSMLHGVDWKTMRGLLTITHDDAKKAAKRLGVSLPDDEIRSALQAPEEITQLVAELKSTGGRTESVIKSLSLENPLIWILGGLIVFGPGVVDILNPSIDLSGPMTAVAQAAALATAVATQVRERLRDVRTFTEHLEEVKTKGAELRTKLLKLPAAQAKLVREYQETQALLEETSAQRDELEDSISETRSRLEALSSGRAVYDFLQAKTAEGEGYRARQGIVSTVRRDLETLSDLLVQWTQDAPKTPEQLDIMELDDERLDRLPLERIVLYIDDLDRCPKERVVEVLQAVHLLLAFDLFVVVVGVDARWLERSLERHFETLLRHKGKQDTSFHREAASPQDYLEKIFQVPFTLPRVQPSGFERLIQKQLLTPAELDEQRRKQTTSEAVPEQGATAAATSEVDPSAPPGTTDTPTDQTSPANAETRDEPPPAPNAVRPPEDASTPPADGSNQEPHGSDRGTDERKAGTNDEQRNGEPEPAGEFYVEPGERRFMTLRLASFIRTPRLIKRFANVYRLLRTSVDPTTYTSFVRDNRHGEHRVVQVMLALNVGFPRIGSELLRLLVWQEHLLPKQARFRTWSEFIESIDPRGARFERGFREFLHPDPSMRNDLEELHGLLVGLEQDVPSELEPWTKWAPKVGRYSMYWQGR